MNSLYVNITNSYTTSGTGIENNPIDFYQFLTHISSGLDDSITYYIDGVRSLSEDEVLTININTITNPNNEDVNVTLTNKLNNPWAILQYETNSESDTSICFNTGDIETNRDYRSPKKLTIKNGIIGLHNYITDEETEYIEFNNMDGNDCVLQLENVYIQATNELTLV